MSNSNPTAVEPVDPDKKTSDILGRNSWLHERRSSVRMDLQSEKCY